MEHAEARELTAAYALDALDEVEEREYEGHLRSCADCREELAGLTETAASLAYAVDAPAPPTDLRERILEQARTERSNVTPLRPRRQLIFATSGIAAAAASIAIGLGIWASSLADDLERERSVAAILADPDATIVEAPGGVGRIVRSQSGETVLVADLPRAQPGKTYEAWVWQAGSSQPEPAGLFSGGEDGDVVRLTTDVPAGGKVAVTVEPAGGVDRPTGSPLFTVAT